MHKIGVSLPSARNRIAVRDAYVKPVRKLMLEKRIGFWSNHMVEDGGDRVDPTGSPLRHHLLMFEVYDFKDGINFLREAFTQLCCPESTKFVDLSECQPLY
jgi:hypothetical protein